MQDWNSSTDRRSDIHVVHCGHAHNVLQGADIKSVTNPQSISSTIVNQRFAESIELESGPTFRTKTLAYCAKYGWKSRQG